MISSITALLFILLGAVIGIIIEKNNSEKKIQRELVAYKAKLEQEKLEIRESIENKLGNIKTSLVATVKAYTDAVDTLNEQIPNKNNPSTYLDLTINDDNVIKGEE